eukprot:GHVR01075896.1.p2 GENE.GHVR01075896.1~~GHVR01075896.1.p2  ORF type:complete len:123 (-),score=57.91 GHVR01075896.1:119-487(-)
MIDESLLRPQQIIWFTSLVARKVTLKIILQRLRTLTHTPRKSSVCVCTGVCVCPCLCVCDVRYETLHQGKQTRWFVAWSFMNSAKREVILRSLGAYNRTEETNTHTHTHTHTYTHTHNHTTT